MVLRHQNARSSSRPHTEDGGADVAHDPWCTKTDTRSLGTFGVGQPQVKSRLMVRFELSNLGSRFAEAGPNFLKHAKQMVTNKWGLHAVPATPEWFIPRQHIKLKAPYRQRGQFATQHHGTWLSATVMISSSQMILSDFVKSATLWSQCRHPHVIELYGACHVSSPRLFVHEHSLNGTLREFLRLEENKKLKWQKLYDAALGLHYLHQRGVVHGDLHCDNIAISSDFRAQIAGLGCTGTCFGPGCREFKAPELLQHKAATPASDIYAFGMCILQLVVESPRGEDPGYVKRERLELKPLSVEDACWCLIKEMCEHNPEKRVTIAYVVKRLEQFAHQERETFQLRSELADCCEGYEIKRGVDSTEYVDASAYIIPGTAMTIGATLGVLQQRCTARSRTECMTGDVLARLLDLYAQLGQKGKKCPLLAVAEFGKIVSRLFDCLKTAVSKKSVNERERSLMVERLHQTFHKNLDHYQDMTNIFKLHAIHEWKHNYKDDASVWSTNAGTAATDCKTPVDEHESVRLVDFRSPRDGSSSHSSNQLSASTEFTKPSWCLPLSELVYDADDSIAEGSFGVVHKGKWLDSPVAIKFLGYESDHGSVSNRLFLHEVQIWSQLKHPHIIEFFGACHVQKRYIVCEYAPHGTLSQYLKLDENKHLVWEKLDEAALGLRYLHKGNIVHNDLRCDNILIGADKKAKLSDFGLSSIPGVVEVTIKKNRIGAAHWKSPECLAGARPSFASDIYSFAMCILEAVTNEAPWGANICAASVGYHLKSGRCPPRPANITDKQWHLIECMTREDPQRRAKVAYVARKLSKFAQAARKARTEPRSLSSAQ
ncbi:Tkl protein kinase, partial [Globisporangium splendens]